MSKTSGGCLLGMLVFGLGLPGFGLFLVGVTAAAITGKSIGAHHRLLDCYIYGAMGLSYVIPGLVLVILVAVCFFEPEMGLMGLGGFVIGIIPWLFIASVLFAFPSSFIANAGCKAGYSESVWAMRAIPAIWGAETAFASDNDKLTCVNGKLKGG